MKKFILLLTVIFLGNISLASDFDNCKMLFSTGQYNKSSYCFYNLLSKDNNPTYRFYYANSLFYQKRYNEAKVQYNNIIQNHPTSNVAKAAKRNLDLTNEQLKTITKSKATDSGNYMSDISYAKWSSMPIKVWVEKSEYSASAKSAFSQWQNKTKGAVRFVFVDKINDAQIFVSFKENIKQAPVGDALGVTSLSFTDGKVIRYAKIDIKTINKSGVKQSSNQIYYVVLHEVGHALGIKGHSKNRYDVMYPSDNTYRNALSNRDINTIKTIYK